MTIPASSYSVNNTHQTLSDKTEADNSTKSTGSNAQKNFSAQLDANNSQDLNQVLQQSPDMLAKLVNNIQHNDSDQHETINGDSSNTPLNGGNGHDLIQGSGTIEGANGRDIIQGSGDRNTVDGGNGKDTIQVSAGNNQIQSSNQPIYSTLARTSDAQINQINIEGQVVGNPVFFDPLGGRMSGGTGSNGNIQTGGANTIHSGNSKDVIQDSGGNDIIHGSNGKDTISITGGNDTIDGGRGVDTAVLNGSINDYDISFTDNQLILTNKHDDSDSKITNVEQFRFADAEVSLQELLRST